MSFSDVFSAKQRRGLTALAPVFRRKDTLFQTRLLLKEAPCPPAPDSPPAYPAGSFRRNGAAGGKCPKGTGGRIVQADHAVTASGPHRQRSVAAAVDDPASPLDGGNAHPCGQTLGQDGPSAAAAADDKNPPQPVHNCLSLRRSRPSLFFGLFYRKKSLCHQ